MKTCIALDFETTNLVSLTGAIVEIRSVQVFKALLAKITEIARFLQEFNPAS